jgi:hypothetical protein
LVGVGDNDGLVALVVEVDVEDGGAAAVPDFLCDGEAEEDHSFGGFAGTDHGLAKERGGREGFDFGEGGIDVVEVLLLNGAGRDFFAVGGGEGGGEVFEEEGKMEAVVDAESGEDVEVVFSALVGDDDGLGFEDGVGGVDGGVGDGEVGGVVGDEAEEESKDNAQNQEG